MNRDSDITQYSVASKRSSQFELLYGNIINAVVDDYLYLSSGEAATNSVYIIIVIMIMINL